MNASWKTTLFGLMAGIGAAILGGYELKPELLAGFPKWLPGIALLMSSIGTACVGLAARDNNVTSEQAGAGGTAGPSRLVPLVLMLVMLSGLCAGVSLVGGCGTTPQKAAYATASTTAVTVDAAMAAWGDYVHQFHPPASQEAVVKAAFDKYKAAMLALVDANQLYVTLAGAGSTNAPPALDKSTQAQQQAVQAIADLLALIRQSGVKI
jgi:hypothetical protein